MKKLLPLILIWVFAISACKKNDPTAPTDNTNPTDSVTVYTAGYITDAANLGHATYWKNKVATTFNTNVVSEAYAIAVKGSDIYVAGFYYTKQNVALPCYWKNGVLKTLTTDTTKNGVVYGIAFKGNDVYMAGVIQTAGHNSTAVYWKNDVITYLDADVTSTALDIIVHDDDVYIAGIEDISPNISGAVYWKNGVLTKLSDSPYGSYALRITVNNNDVYVAGQVNMSTDWTSVYWKNNIATTISEGVDPKYYDTNIRPTGIGILGNDIYISGYSGPAPITSPLSWLPIRARYWKNGSIVNLSAPDMEAALYAMTIHGQDIYYAGTDLFGKAAYWKNGAPAVDLNTTQLSIALAIFVTHR